MRDEAPSAWCGYLSGEAWLSVRASVAQRAEYAKNIEIVNENLMDYCSATQLSAEKIKDALTAGGNPNAKSKRRQTYPLNMLTELETDNESQRLEGVKALLDAGANPNAKDIYQTTPLHNAAYRGSIEIVKLLLAKGADVNAKEIHKATPLMMGVMSGNSQVVEMLINAGADIDQKDQSGKSALDYAKEGNKAEIIKLLQ